MKKSYSQGATCFIMALFLHPGHQSLVQNFEIQNFCLVLGATQNLPPITVHIYCLVKEIYCHKIIYKTPCLFIYLKTFRLAQGTTCFLRTGIFRTSIHRPRRSSDQGIRKVTFPDQFKDIHVPRPA